MLRSLLIGFVPYVATIVGIPLFNREGVILGLPPLAFWICLCVLATPVFMYLAERALPESEREEQE